MTRTYSAGGSRRGAVFAAIVGFHFAMFLLVANGLGPVPIDTSRKDPPVVHLLPPETKPWVAIVPDTPAPAGRVEAVVQEPVVLPVQFPDLSADPVLRDSGAAAGSQAGDTTTGVASAPQLRMRGDRLAALVNACYPAGSRRSGEEGRALVRLLVGTRGEIRSWRLLSGTGYPRLDEAIRCIIDRLSIEPGRRDGRAVEAEAMLPIVFRLD